jgi:hypothetical protein
LNELEDVFVVYVFKGVMRIRCFVGRDVAIVAKVIYLCPVQVSRTELVSPFCVAYNEKDR